MSIYSSVNTLVLVTVDPKHVLETHVQNGVLLTMVPFVNSYFRNVLKY